MFLKCFRTKPRQIGFDFLDVFTENGYFLNVFPTLGTYRSPIIVHQSSFSNRRRVSVYPPMYLLSMNTIGKTFGTTPPVRQLILRRNPSRSLDKYWSHLTTVWATHMSVRKAVTLSQLGQLDLLKIIFPDKRRRSKVREKAYNMFKKSLGLTNYRIIR